MQTEDILTALTGHYYNEIRHGIEGGALRRNELEPACMVPKEQLLRTYRARAIGLKRKNTAYSIRLAEEILVLLRHMDVTEDRAIELLRLEETGTKKS